jgi:LemA protein
MQSHFAVTFVMVLAAVIIPAFFLLMWLVSSYNQLVALRNRCKSAFAQIDLQLRRRYALIPKLVEIAKVHIKNPRGSVEAVIAARNAASAASERAVQSPGNAAAMSELSSAEALLSDALGQFLAVAAANPEFKANRTTTALMEELTSTDNEVDFARQAYNDVIIAYNAARKVFPANTLAGPFEFPAAELFVIEKRREKKPSNAALTETS